MVSVSDPVKKALDEYELCETRPGLLRVLRQFHQALELQRVQLDWFKRVGRRVLERGACWDD